jgi:hypothetical protein
VGESGGECWWRDIESERLRVWVGAAVGALSVRMEVRSGEVAMAKQVGIEVGWPVGELELGQLYIAFS